jgi:single-strand DNA-binding protein
MNEVTIHGNLTAAPVIHHGTERAVTSFDVAVNSRYFSRATNAWKDNKPVFHKVVCFGELAENAADTLLQGMTVTVTGEFRDNSFVSEESGKQIRQTRVVAEDVAVSLRRATAEVTRRRVDQETA